jgi:hypothetical protein
VKAAKRIVSGRIAGRGEASRIVKRDDGYVRSQNVAQEMTFVSLPDGENIDDYYDFVYDKSAGSGVTLYIVDSGAELSNDAVRRYTSNNFSGVADASPGIRKDRQQKCKMDPCKRSPWWQQ